MRATTCTLFLLIFTLVHGQDIDVYASSFRMTGAFHAIVDQSEYLEAHGIITNTQYRLAYFPSSCQQMDHYQGVAFAYHNLNGSTVMGRPLVIDYVLGLGLLSRTKMDVVLEQRLGVAYGWKRFDKLTNPENLHFSSRSSLSYGLSLISQVAIAKRVRLLLNADVQHFSNGALRRPNLGLNSVGVGLGISYLLTRPADGENYTLAKQPAASESKKTIVKLAMGSKQPLFIDEQAQDTQTDLSKYQHQNYGLVSLQTAHYRNLGNTHFLGAGLDLSYDPTANLVVVFDQDDRLVSARSESVQGALKLAPFLSYRYEVGAINLMFDYGLYLIGEVDFGGISYQRLGLSFDVAKSLALGFAVRSAGFPRSDWLEFSVGYER